MDISWKPVVDSANAVASGLDSVEAAIVFAALVIFVGLVLNGVFSS